MDTFGRLPNDVIDRIEEIYQLPTINFVYKEKVNTTYLVIDLHYIKVRFIAMYLNEHVSKKDYYKNTLPDIKQFIDNINKNIPCVYKESYYFEINYNTDNIIVTDSDTKLTLKKSCTNVLLDALNKYYDMLDNYKLHKNLKMM
jgi:hypothetical protein